MSDRVSGDNGDSLPVGVGVYLRGRTWWYSAQVNGRRIQRSTKKKNRLDAIEMVREEVLPLITAKAVGEVAGRMQMVLANASPLLLRQVWREWSELPAGRRMGATKLGSYRTPWSRFHRWMAANAPRVSALHEVSLDDCERFMLSLDGLAGRTQFNYRRVLLRIFKDLGRRAGMAGNPWEQVPIPQADTESYEAFTPAQLRRIGEESTGPIRDVFVAGCYTGLRMKDITRLVWAPGGPDDLQVDLQAGFIFGRMSKTRSSARSQGFVELPILPPLAGYLAGRAAMPGEPVFPDLHGWYRRNRFELSGEIQKFLVGLGFETRRDVPGRGRSAIRLGVHSLRHTFVYQAGMAGVPLAVVQRVVGHMSERMTMTYNQHARRAELLSHMQRVPDLMGLADITAAPAADGGALDGLLAQLDGPDAVKAAIRAMLAKEKPDSR